MTAHALFDDCGALLATEPQISSMQLASELSGPYDLNLSWTNLFQEMGPDPQSFYRKHAYSTGLLCSDPMRSLSLFLYSPPGAARL